ncbi:hypothetical protein Thena_0756 [Thermodesulfobium narugense DSM 14796]|uniref:Uncharacterized protein n=1 Tax=Thermodesulfobium narugense DSM 14796 TaxID=747365 RepID=M1E7B7_9BACT|nr:hypothetical protein [Thermodesulfobium narugense]AEE14390.1 hypothetical protein Thena_0756 [Thermodesulfobium narugense DSM 14796]
MFEKRLEQFDRLFDKVKELELKSFAIWGPKGCFKKQIVLRLLESIYGYKFSSLYENKPNFFSFVFGKQVENELLSDRNFLREILNDVLWQKRINNEIITVYVEFGNDPQRMRDVVEIPDFFLKIVEEPPENTYFIFLSDFQIISTLRSRCIEIYAPLLSDRESIQLLVSLNKNLKNDEEFADLVYGCPGLLSDKDETTLINMKEKVKLMRSFIKSEKFGGKSYLFDSIYKDMEPYLSIFFFKSLLISLFKKKEIPVDKYLSILDRIKIANEFYVNRVNPSSIFLITNFLLDSKEI